jgi:hypothetical protein
VFGSLFFHTRPESSPIPPEAPHGRHKVQQVSQTKLLPSPYINALSKK